MEEEYGSPGRQKWANFNEFVARTLLPGRRPIAQPDDDHFVTSPADSVFDGSWKIDGEAIVELPPIPDFPGRNTVNF